MATESYSNIREILGWAVGKRIEEITQHDEDEFKEEGSYVMLMLEGGDYLKFPVGEAGFHYCTDGDEESRDHDG